MLMNKTELNILHENSSELLYRKKFIAFKNFIKIIFSLVILMKEYNSVFILVTDKTKSL